MGARERQAEEETSTPAEPARAAPAAAPFALTPAALAATPGLSNQAVAGVVARQYHGSSYARHGPELDERRQAITPQSRLGETEAHLAGEMATSIAWIGDAATKIYALIEDARKADKEGKSFFGDNTLEMTQRLTQIAEALNKLQIGFRATHAKIKDANASLERFEEMDKATQTLTLVVNGLATLKSGAETNAKLQAFQAKPDAKSAEAWADSVVDTFDNFGKVVGAIPFPPGLGFIPDLWQGLLSAPKSYVGFFKGTMKVRYGELDRAIGRTEDYHQFLRTGETVVWKGPACPMVQDAWFFDQNLQNWMVQLQKDKGFGATDLYVYAPRELATLLLDRLQGSSQSEETKTRWGGWLASRAK